MARKNMVIGGIFLVGVSFILGAIIRPLTPCQRLDAKIKATESLCSGIAKEYAERTCSEQTSDPETLTMCNNMIIPIVASKCLSTSEVTQMRQDLLNFCQE